MPRPSEGDLVTRAYNSAVEVRSIRGSGTAARSTSVWWPALLVAGLIVRLALAAGTTNSLDLKIFGTIALDGAIGRRLYDDGVFSYPPLWGAFFLDAGRALGALGLPVFAIERPLLPYAIPNLTTADLTTPLASLFIKLPAFFGDAFATWAIFSVARASGAAQWRAEAACLGWWLSPLVLFTSGVQAGWDGFVGAVFLVVATGPWRDRWLGPGIALGLGIAAKLVPLTALVALPGALVRPPASAAPRRLVAFALGGAFALWAGFVPVLVTGQLETMRSALFTRAGTFSVGGANLWGVAGIEPLEVVRAFAEAHRNEIGRVSAILSLLVGAAVAVLLVRGRRAGLEAPLYAAVAIAGVLCATSPLVQPSYMLWLMPALFALGAVRGGRWLPVAHWLGIVGFAFIATVRGAGAVVVPACAFFRVCDPVAAAASAAQYAATPGPWSQRVQIDLDALLGEVLGILVVAAVAGAIVGLVRVSPAAPVRLARVPPRSGRSAGAGGGAAGSLEPAILLLVALAVFAAYAELPAGAARAGAIRTALVVDGLDRDVPDPTVVALFGDARYRAGRGVSPRFLTGLPAHVRDDVARRGIAAPIRLLDARTLPAFLAETPNRRLLFVPGGILPQNVRSADGGDLLISWVRSGGTVVWAGAPFDRIVSAPAPGPEGLPPVRDAGDAPWRNDLRGLFTPAVDPFSPAVGRAARPAERWPIGRIDFDRTTFPVDASRLRALGGSALGYIDAHDRSSISFVPLGLGRIVFFGDGFDDEIEAADALGQLIYSGLWSDPARVRALPLRDGRELAAAIGRDPSIRLRAFGDTPNHEPFISTR